MKKGILILILLILSLFSVSCICASDVNDTLAVSDDTAAIEAVQSDDEELILEDNFVDDKPIFGEEASTDSFTDLNYLINTKYSSNDTITLSRNYTFNGNDDDDSNFIPGISINHGVTIDGKNHVLDGANCSRILLISHANVTLKNLVFVNGFADDGGAIHLNNSTLLISNCTFTHNRVNVSGGALYASLSDVNIAESSFSYNCGGGLYVSGGAVHLYNSSANMSHSIFLNNTADAGGAVFALGSSLNINGSEFSYNTANFYGGGVFSEFCLKINSTVFHDNRAGLKGGAIHASYLTEDNGIMDVNNSILFNNHAQYGGVVSSSNGGHNLIQNSKLYSNTATYGAVIARFSENSIEISNCDCHDNEAANGTVVFAQSCGNVTLKNSNFTKNSGEYGSLIYTIQGRRLMEMSSYNITVSGCNAIDNRAVDSLIYNFYASIIVDNSSFVYEHGQYPVFVMKKLGTGSVSYENNFWGVENPDFSKLIYINSTAQNQDSDLSSANHDEDCSSNVIQIDENHTVSSFRRDSSRHTTLFIGGNGEIRQEKLDITYFTHMIITREGWVMGNGGLDMPYLNERIEGIARKMIENDEISLTYLEMIFSMKSFEYNRGHFIIKSPDGRYGIADYFNKTKAIEIGVLKSGEYILCPNNYALHRMGNISDLPVSGYVEASRYLAGIDLYGTSRTTVQTYEYLREVSGSHLIAYLDCYVSNDDGHLKNSSYEKYFNDIFSNGRYIPGEEIPYIMDGKYLGRFVLNEVQLPSIETKITARDLKIVYNNGKYMAVGLHDVWGKPIANADLKIKLNGKVYGRVTDSMGQAKLFVNPAPKTYKAHISFAGNGIYAKSSGDVKITVKKAIPKLTAKKKTFRAKNKVKKYTVTLKTNKNKALSKAKVTLKVNGKTYKATTNKKGQATFKIAKLTKKGKFTAVVKYTGSKYYNAKTVKPKITVK